MEDVRSRSVFWGGVMPGSVEPVLLLDVEFWVRKGWKCGGAKVPKRNGIVYSG